MTKIKKCECKHDYQDKKYGKGNRVMNSTVDGWRCTVCGKEKK
jgi:hypothetical protein